MTLAAYQETFQKLMMTEQGKQALQSSEVLSAYLKQSGLSDTMQQDFLRQPIDRLQQYEYMVEANVREVVQNIYPHCRQVLGDRWGDVYQAYFCSCPSRVYSLMGCAEAFPEYLESREDLLSEFPWLAELALYEWVEAELLSARNPVAVSLLEHYVPETVESLQQWSLVLNPVALLLQFVYPIPAVIEALKANGEFTPPPEPMQPSMILVYRDPESLSCRYFQLTPVLAAWLSLLQESQHPSCYADSLRPLLDSLTQSGAVTSAADFYAAFLAMLPDLLQKRVLLGSLKSI